MTTCVGCRTVNQAGARYCKACGAGLTPHTGKTVALPPQEQIVSQPSVSQTQTPPATQQLSQPHDMHLADGELLRRDRYEVLTCLEQTPQAVYLVRERMSRVCPQCRCDNAHDADYCDNCGTTLSPQPRYLLVEYAEKGPIAGALALAQARFRHPAFISVHDGFSHMAAASQKRYYLLKEAILANCNHLGVRSVQRLSDHAAIRLDEAIALLSRIAPALDALVEAGFFLPALSMTQLLLVVEGYGTEKSSSVQIDGLETAQPFGAAQRGQINAHHNRLLARLVVELTRGATLPPALATLLSEPTRLEHAGTARECVTLLELALRPSALSGQGTVVVGKLTDLGRMRKINEDSILTLELDQFHKSANAPLRLYALADGMGGHDAGEVASKLALNQLSRSLLEAIQTAVAHSETPPSFDYAALLKQAGQAAAKAVHEHARRSRSDLGTTLVATLVDVAGRKAHVINVGDSRLYKINAGGIRQVTRDHSMVQLLLDRQQITPEQARAHPNANLIYRTLGEKANIEIDSFVETLTLGDSLLLCSDGLSGLVDDEQLRAVTLASPTPQAACTRLVELANQAGGHDNISVIIVRLQAEKG